MKSLKEQISEFFKKHPNENNEFYYTNFPNIMKSSIRPQINELRKAELNKEFDKDSHKIWLFIINNENWEIVRKTNIIGSEYKSKINLVKEEDIIIIYIKSPYTSIVGIFKVILFYKDTKPIFHEKVYPYRLKLKPIKIAKKSVKIQSLLDDLNFIRNKKKWASNIYGGKGIIQLSLKDYNTINKAL